MTCIGKSFIKSRWAALEEVTHAVTHDNVDAQWMKIILETACVSRNFYFSYLCNAILCWIFDVVFCNLKYSVFFIKKKNISDNFW